MKCQSFLCLNKQRSLAARNLYDITTETEFAFDRCLALPLIWSQLTWLQESRCEHQLDNVDHFSAILSDSESNFSAWSSVNSRALSRKPFGKVSRDFANDFNVTVKLMRGQYFKSFLQGEAYFHDRVRCSRHFIRELSIRSINIYNPAIFLW